MMILDELNSSRIFLVVFRSIFKVSRFLLLIPTISASVLHAFSNAGLLLRDAEEVQAERDSVTNVDFLQGLIHPLPAFATFVIPSLIMFWIAAGMPLHPRLHRLAVKWKLIEPVTEKELPVQES